MKIDGVEVEKIVVKMWAAWDCPFREGGCYCGVDSGPTGCDLGDHDEPPTDCPLRERALLVVLEEDGEQT